jgi:hypothetical protein
MELKLEPPRSQELLPTQPYDRWVSPEGYCQAEFHKADAGFLIRFPGQADFLIKEPQTGFDFGVTGWPAPECDDKTAINLFHNAIQPILGNHSGGLFLHGSAVMAGEQGDEAGAVAFLGLSRGGKTTLAGSFARSGNPFLTEDVIDLRLNDGHYLLQPKRSKLRLFADSARYLFGENTPIEDADMKQDVEAGSTLPFANRAVPLRQIYVLGTDHSAPLSIRRYSMQEALSALMPHAFILDVEDKPRLKAHFARMADLSQDIECYSLDFTRDYAELPRVRAAILDNCQGA